MSSTAESTLPPPPAVSMKTIPMAGLLVDVYGLEELSSPCPAARVTCLWLHHPRLQTKETMGDFARRAVSAWNERRGSGAAGAAERGVVALAFDQRNHGSREVFPLANESWRAGNERHAVDMMGAIRGMAEDTRGLIDVVGGYLGVEGEVDGHFVLGWSLGGHSAWQLMFSDERVTAGVLIIGCPDYMALMSGRAQRSKLSTYNAEDGGASFLGSEHFPKDLVALCRRADPKGILFGTGPISTAALDEKQRAELGAVLDARVKGKRFLVCSGADDRLVPYRVSEPFLKFFTDAAGGWYKTGGVTVENKVYEGVGHAFSDGMVADAVRFVVDALSEGSREDKSKI
ncbi:uncharacterized protein DNG_01027 [Cephalotrichum gorgonifer]|uniref:AB hydrolase-1 domain-containing protein n=1 Tax=Cephalotrichum gorgonifer TaxID=2041049 RepID=A0AAE8SRV4_9PEZI|nr:uncharacterized protein DNG_01027 [Cephalotrichum gorgonifer]